MINSSSQDEDEDTVDDENEIRVIFDEVIYVIDIIKISVINCKLWILFRKWF